MGGFRNAIGARGLDILIQFLVETVVMGILGGMAGPVAGFTRRGTVISPFVMIVAAGFIGCGESLLWLLPGSEGGCAESDRSPEV